MNPIGECEYLFTRRQFFGLASAVIGTAALGSRMGASGAHAAAPDLVPDGVLNALHHAPRAKRVIYLFQSGAPSQLDLFDYKPLLNELNTQELPESVRKGQRLTGMTSGQASFPLGGSIFNFKRHGKCGA